MKKSGLQDLRSLKCCSDERLGESLLFNRLLKLESLLFVFFHVNIGTSYLSFSPNEL